MEEFKSLNLNSKVFHPNPFIASKTWSLRDLCKEDDSDVKVVERERKRG